MQGAQLVDLKKRTQLVSFRNFRIDRFNLLIPIRFLRLRQVRQPGQNTLKVRIVGLRELGQGLAAEPVPAESEVGIRRVFPPMSPCSCAQLRTSSRLVVSSGRMKPSSVAGRIPAKPVSPEPRNNRNSTVSAWSLRVCPNATRSRPSSSRQRRKNARRAAPRLLLEIAGWPGTACSTTIVKTERLSQLAHERFIAIGLFATQMMVHVQHDQLAPERGEVCARARRNPRRPIPLHPRGRPAAACYNEG